MITPRQTAQGKIRNCIRKMSLVCSFFLAVGFTSENLLFADRFAQTSASSRVPRDAMTAAAKNQPTPTPSPKLILKVYDYAHVQRWLLSNSEDITSAIFKAAGVETAWIDCPLSAMEVPRYPDCQSKIESSYLVLKILPRSMEMKLSTRAEALGLALPCPGWRACDISVFYDRVADIATGEYRTDRILGHVIAHEAGHALLGPGSHSRTGIMRAGWSPGDLQRMSLGFLDFTDDQCRRLRTNLLAASQN